METLKKTEHKFVLSYEDCPEIREMYIWANVYGLAFHYRVQDSNTSDSKRKVGQELIISNCKFNDLDNLELF